MTAWQVNREGSKSDFLQASDIAESWEGLSADTVIMNWNLGNSDSLGFCADRGLEQVIAGYYDSGDGYAIRLWS